MATIAASAEPRTSPANPGHGDFDKDGVNIDREIRNQAGLDRDDDLATPIRVRDPLIVMAFGGDRGGV